MSVGSGSEGLPVTVGAWLVVLPEKAEEEDEVGAAVVADVLAGLAEVVGDELLD